MDTLTVEQFKRDLPNVLVKWCGKTYTGHPTGRLLPFCHLALCDNGKRRIMGPIFEVSWDTVTRCYNTNRKVIC
jgi:hypothetical protein